MLKKNLLLVLALSFNAQAFGQTENQIKDQIKEKVILSLNAPESAKCNDKIFNQHAFKLTVTQAVLPDGTLDTSKSKIYEDGVLKGLCRNAVETIGFNDYSKVFTNLKIIKELSNEDVLKIFRTNFVGYCRYNWNFEIYKSASTGNLIRNELLKTMLEEKSIELDSNNREEILVGVLKDLAQGKQCGTFSKEIIQQTKESNLKKLALADVGFDYLVGEKTTKNEFLKVHFNAIKLNKEFNVTLLEFKENQYTANELSNAGFSSEAIYKAGFPLQDLFSNEDVSELRKFVSIQKFIAAGADIAMLKKVGFNEISEIKPFFKIDDFKKLYNDIYDNNKAPKELKRLGYKAFEIKEVGYGISPLRTVGFDEIKEIKPLFTIKDFQTEYKDYYDNNKAPKELKRLGYSTKEIKEIGYGINPLKAAGFDEIKEIKPLFTIKDFQAEYKDYYDNNKAPKELKRLGYSIKEIKEIGYGINALKAVGFDEIKEIKPLFSIKEFQIEYKDYYDNNKAPRELKRLGYTANEIKEIGYGINALKAAGFDEIKVIKPLFTIKDFQAEYKDYYDNNKAPRELKRLGFSKEEVKALGYDEDSLKAAGY